MQTIPLDAEIHLTCVRGGGCCHAQRIPVTPWEIASLARALGISAAEARDRHTAEGGTRLRSSGAADARGRKACSLHDPARGCTVHDGRPLACRLFPLGRSLVDARATYHLAGESHPCASPCPSIRDRAPVRVDDWLAAQNVGAGETAHDAYGRLVCGLLGQAAVLADPRSQAFADGIRASAALTAEQRAQSLPWPWYELLTAPGLMDLIDEPVQFVLAHADRLLGAVRTGFAGEGDRAAVLVASLAIHLGDPLGIPSGLAIDHALSLRASGLATASA